MRDMDRDDVLRFLAEGTRTGKLATASRSYAEIAQVTGLSMGNVGFLLHTGLNKLRIIATEHHGDAHQLRTIS